VKGELVKANKNTITGMKLCDWEPKPVLVTKVTNILKPRFPVIDVHNHLGEVKDWDNVVKEMDAAGVVYIINLDGGRRVTVKEGKREYVKCSIDEYVKAMSKEAKKRVVTFTCPFVDNTLPIHSSNFGDMIAAQIEKDVAKGVKGLKIHKSLGLNLKDEKGNLIRVDEESLNPIWEKCAELDIPVLIHTADPVAFFQPIDRFNERWLTLKIHPEWQFPPLKFPTYTNLLKQRDNLLKNHPKTKFIGAHVGSASHNLNYVSLLVDKYPNFYVDISARILELGRQPRKTRNFFTEYQDRILFGTDIRPDMGKREYYRTSYRFLETTDEYFLSPEGRPPLRPHCARPWFIYGIDLPNKVLEKIYYRNAEKIIPGLEV
jgi:predicted TIM-barrel fold metal-dependent hydrolase